MILLVDTSVWIDHFRTANSTLDESLSEGLVLMHPFISGELACGNLKSRATLLYYLNALPPATPATDKEVLKLVDNRALFGKGLGWVDVHLLASAILSHCRFWTLDKSLRRAAEDLGLSQL